MVEEAAGYTTRHPGPLDVGLVVEVSDSTPAGDRADKGRIYARAGLTEYWIVNLADRQVEVYSLPSGPDEAATYRQRRDFQVGDDLEVVLAGHSIARLAVADIFR